MALADTIGVGVPRQVEHLVQAVAERGASVRCHFHNTRNTGYANAFAAIRSGATALDASVGGYGGCPFSPSATGNVATEDTVFALERSGLRTGLDTVARRAQSIDATSSPSTSVCERYSTTTST